MRPAPALLLAATLSACTATGVYRVPPRGSRGYTTSATAAAASSAGAADVAAEEGDASFYSDRLAGNTTANGERYDPEALTAAHRTLRFGTRVEVRRENGARDPSGAAIVQAPGSRLAPLLPGSAGASSR